MDGRHVQVERSATDLVINVGRVTLGEKNRGKLTENQRKQERNKVIMAACSLLNSGGGVIYMEVVDKDNLGKNMEMGLDLEKALRGLIDPFQFPTHFTTLSQGQCYFIFVKSWSNGVSPENNSTIPRICSQNVFLFERSSTQTINMNPIVAVNFLKNKKREKHDRRRGPPPKRTLKTLNPNIEEKDPVALIFQRDRLERGEVLPFSESLTVEFKEYSTKHITDYVKDTIPKLISAFANTEGGYFFIGVEDGSCKVVGFSEEKVKPDYLRQVIKRNIDKLPVFHFCSSQCSISYTIKLLEVYEKGKLCGYVCAIRVEPFCCVVFSKSPISWIVKDGSINRLSTEEWMNMILDADLDLSLLAQNFDSQLNLGNCPPLSRPVYCQKDLEHKEELQKRLFPVPSEEIKYHPDSLCKELFSEHEGLEELMNKQVSKEKCSPGILIFSRSWAVDIGLKENPRVLCDALLIAANSFPVLYTVLREHDREDYSIHTALMLKQKLVNIGGYTERVCIIPKILILNSGSDTTEVPKSSGGPIIYPSSYKMIDENMTGLLQSLVIVLLSFRSFLSDRLGYEVLNLLTIEQYNVVSKNLHKCPELFVHGFPGTGKTIIAMKIIEKIKNVFNCEEKDILYICENQPLRNFVRDKNICEAVTRKSFLSTSKFEEIKHIIIDEAQNFRQEEESWYMKAKMITQKRKGPPGMLWIFLDYFQTSHVDCSGLPHISKQYPREQLTRIVRNADPIADFIKQNMEMIKRNPPFCIDPASLEILDEACWSSGVKGFCEIRKNLTLDEIVTYVAEECKKLFRMGYSSKNIAILVSTCKDIEYYKEPLKQATKKIRGLKISTNPNEKSNCIVLDSIRRFSGLERNIVFGLHPVTNLPDVSLNLLVCLASRALTHLYILYRMEYDEVVEQDLMEWD